MDEVTAGLIGALVGAVISFLVGYLAYKAQCRQVFAETVSQSRMDWINNFREEFSIVIGTARCAGKCSQKPAESDVVNNVGHDYCLKVLEAEIARAKLITRLNSDVTKRGNEYNNQFQTLLMKLNFTGSDDSNDIEKLEKIAKYILEPEWARVKKEARGKNV